ncbi:conserved hypothetical protein [Luteimonas sp. 9C]|uniref:hypothetical protein n=1 Tax=Luteimonas sp. 9C TaxID=2653148 RepID=UPI0012F1E9D8|nr:hypothetical protein [Luteimonas sp. 9C]VXB72303.1 conserved hypothetical protein [Luteimonas sp. 9C]
MFRALKEWYKGKTVETGGYNAPGILTLPKRHIEYHWTARFARSLVGFYLKHWQWVWGSAIAIVGIYVAYLAIPRGQ